METLLASPITYVVGVVVLLALLIGLAVALERRERRRYERLLAEGEPAEATVLSARDTGWRTNGRPHIAFELEVRRQGRPPYRATARLSIHRPWTPIPYPPGAVVPVRVDPDDPRQVAIAAPGVAEAGGLGLGPPMASVSGSSVYVVDGRSYTSATDLPPEARAAPAQAAAMLGDADGDGAPDLMQPAARPGAAERLRELQQLRDAGLISAEEHAAKRAAILKEL